MPNDIQLNSEVETPEPEVPETPEPEVPETPESEVPETPEPEVPETPESEVPETPEPEVPAPQPSIVLESSLLLDRYYEQRALSMLPIGHEPYFQLGDIDWGYGFIEEINGKPSVESLPSVVESLEKVFATNRPVYNFINGQIIITCNLPAGSIAVGESEQFSCIGVKDQDGKYVALAVTQPIWVYSDRGISCEVVINTNLGESANMMVSA